FRRLELHLSTLWNVRVATRVIAVSQATRDDLIRHYRTVPDRVHVVHHGVSPRFRPTQDPGVRARYGLPERYFLYLGTLQPRKNLERLLAAYARLPAGAPAFVLAGGRGWYFERIARAVAAHNLGERVLFPGYIADADLPAVLSGAVAFVYPSLYEGFGMPLLEAMACGTPVIASRSSSLPEVVGDAGLLVDPLSVEALQEALQRILEDEPLREALRARGLERARLFTWERCAHETLGVLEKALAARARAKS
ncbi:MAG: glycosyltransferase family 4 protein, partial [Chloroflexia bacterium]